MSLPQANSFAGRKCDESIFVKHDYCFWKNIFVPVFQSLFWLYMSRIDKNKLQRTQKRIYVSTCIYISISMYIYIYIYYIYIYIYIYNHENNVPSRLSLQSLRGNSCTWAHNVRFVLITGTTHCFHDCIYIYIYIVPISLM